MPRTNQKDSYWLEIFEQYRASGKSQRQFCIENNHPYSQFKYYWEKLIHKPKRAESITDSHFVPVTIGPSQEKTKTTLSRPAKAVIELPNDVRCTLSIESGLEDFGTLLKQLVSLC